jgi:hypothetical protein
MKNSLIKLEEMNPCYEGLEWARGQRTLVKAWENCERPDWMFWFLRKKSLLDKPTSVRLACIFAKDVLNIFEKKYPKDLRPRQAIEAALEYLENPTEKMRMKCKSAAAYAYAAAAAAAYAYAAAYAAAAAYATADAADAAAAYAAYAADAAAANAADAAAYAKKEKKKWQAGQIRTLVSNPFK